MLNNMYNEIMLSEQNAMKLEIKNIAPKYKFQGTSLKKLFSKKLDWKLIFKIK